MINLWNYLDRYAWMTTLELRSASLRDVWPSTNWIYIIQQKIGLSATTGTGSTFALMNAWTSPQRQMLIYLGRTLGRIHDLELMLCPSIFSTRYGFAMALLAILKLRRGGLLVLGPPCGSFVWVNLATSKRSVLNPFGDSSRPHVSMGNLCLWLINRTYMFTCRYIAFRIDSCDHNVLGWWPEPASYVFWQLSVVHTLYWSNLSALVPGTSHLYGESWMISTPIYSHVIPEAFCFLIANNNVRAYIHALQYPWFEEFRCTELDGNLGAQIYETISCMGNNAMNLVVCTFVFGIDISINIYYIIKYILVCTFVYRNCYIYYNL